MASGLGIRCSILLSYGRVQLLAEQGLFANQPMPRRQAAMPTFNARCLRWAREHASVAVKLHDAAAASNHASRHYIQCIFAQFIAISASDRTQKPIHPNLGVISQSSGTDA